MANMLPLFVDTYTMPLATAGWNMMLPSTVAVHRTSPVEADMHTIWPALVPMNSLPLTMAGGVRVASTTGPWLPGFLRSLAHLTFSVLGSTHLMPSPMAL